MIYNIIYTYTYIYLHIYLNNIMLETVQSKYALKFPKVTQTFLEWSFSILWTLDKQINELFIFQKLY